MTVTDVPSPADVLALPTARELVDEIIARGGRVHRMPVHSVFVLTQDPELARWLLELKGITYKPPFAQRDVVYPLGSYKRSPEGKPEWDIWIHQILVRGDQSIHEVVGEIHGIPTVRVNE